MRASALRWRRGELLHADAAPASPSAAWSAHMALHPASSVVATHGLVPQLPMLLCGRGSHSASVGHGLPRRAVRRVLATRHIAVG